MFLITSTFKICKKIRFFQTAKVNDPLKLLIFVENIFPEFNLTLQGQLIGKSTDANEFPNTKSILYHLVRIEGQAYGGQTGFYDEHVNTVFTQFPQDDLKFPIYEKPWSAMNVNIYLSEGGPYTIMMPPVTTRMYVEFQVSIYTHKFCYLQIFKNPFL